MEEFFTQFWNLIVTFINPLNLVHPEKYTEALRTAGAIWPSLVAVSAIVFTETGLLIGFLPARRFAAGRRRHLHPRRGMAAAAVHGLPLRLRPSSATRSATGSGRRRGRRSSSGPTAGSSSRPTCRRRRPSTRSTAARRSSSPGSSRSSGRSCRSSPARREMQLPHVPLLQRHRRHRLDRQHARCSATCSTRC